MPLEIVPALLAASKAELENQFKKVKPYFSRVQLDVVDGLFAPNVSVGLESFDWFSEVKVDLHLMVNKPEDYLNHCTDFKLHRVISQIESVANQAVFIRRVKSMGFKPGLALDIETPAEDLEMAVLGELEYVLVLGVKAGLSGQSFQPRALEKISLLDRWRKADDGFNFTLGVDGGIDLQTIGAIRKAGADEVAVTSFLLKSESIGKALKELQR